MKGEERVIAKLGSLIEEGISYGDVSIVDDILFLLISYLPNIYNDGDLDCLIDSLREVMIYNVCNGYPWMNMIICDNILYLILLNHKRKDKKIIINEMELFADQNRVKRL